ncbi:hypothetical protein HDU81_009052 [Chytriomyces hyalinus]|nr:hypothetical protein HDU81_009052 [Chytriomyces hyalinus]
MDILQAVHHQQASPEVRYYCLYMYYYQGFTNRAQLGRMFGKHGSTITSWIEQYEKGDGTERARKATVYKKHGPERRQWLVELYRKRPVLHLKQAKELFTLQFPGSSVASSTIAYILKEAGLTWKVLERQAIQICQADIVRFAEELMDLPWILENLAFLDEVSFDNHDMLAKRGYRTRGERLTLLHWNRWLA